MNVFAFFLCMKFFRNFNLHFDHVDESEVNIMPGKSGLLEHSQLANQVEGFRFADR